MLVLERFFLKLFEEADLGCLLDPLAAAEPLQDCLHTVEDVVLKLGGGDCGIYFVEVAGFESATLNAEGNIIQKLSQKKAKEI